MPGYDPTPEQLAILQHEHQRHGQILAGPGSGKSSTIVAWIDRQLFADPPPRLRLLTFTRAATAELAGKVSVHSDAILDRPSTIHSFAISVLMQNPGVAPFPEPLRIGDDPEELHIIYPTLARRTGVTVRVLKKLIREMAAGWESLGPREDPKITPDLRARFVGSWQEHRGVFGYTFLSELPFALRDALANYPDLNGVDYHVLIVDEYQDLNACDLDVLRQLAEHGCSLLVAGDDDQSIYSFRMAHPEGIRRFTDEYSDAASYNLSETKRCGQTIIQWAKHVIEGDPDRPRDRPPFNAAKDAPVGESALLSFENDLSEAHGIARLVHSLITVQSVPPSDVLVLLKSDHNSAFSTPIKEALSALGVPTSDPDSVKRELREPNVRFLLALFRLKCNPEDSLAWATLLQLAPGVGPAFLDWVYQKAAAERRQFGKILLESWRNGFDDAPHAPARKAGITIQRLHTLLDSTGIPDERPEIGWGHWIATLAGTAEYPDIAEAMKDILREVDGHPDASDQLERFVGQIGPLGRDVETSKSGGVRIMSMMGAKGLTVKAAVVGAVEEGIIPRDEASISEERRLLYVAMTRPTDFLYCTWARSRTGPTARAGRVNVGQRRRYSSFFDHGPVESQNGEEYLTNRYPDA